MWSRSRYWKDPDAPGGLEGGVHAIDDADAFARIMGSLGIGNDSRVVAYDGSGGLYAARFWWTCRRFGFDAVQVLHGGLDKWYAEGRPLSKVNERPAPAPFVATGPDDGSLCRLDDVRRDCASDAHVFWDVRSDGEWTGANTRGTKRGGRVPNAAHLEWLETLEHPVRTLEVAGGAARAAGRAGHHAREDRHDVLTGGHPCGARIVPPRAAGLPAPAALRRLLGRVRQRRRRRRGALTPARQPARVERP